MSKDTIYTILLEMKDVLEKEINLIEQRKDSINIFERLLLTRLIDRLEHTNKILEMIKNDKKKK